MGVAALTAVGLVCSFCMPQSIFVSRPRAVLGDRGVMAIPRCLIIQGNSKQIGRASLWRRSRDILPSKGAASGSASGVATLENSSLPNWG